MSLLPNSNQPHWALTNEDKVRYLKVFNNLPKDANNHISGLDCRETLMKSNLNITDLQKVWKLSDQNNKGKLDQNEFFIAMHLIYIALAGNPLPNVLPLELTTLQIYDTAL